MSAWQTATESILLAIPMIGIVFAALFRLDAVFSAPKKPGRNGHPLSHVDSDGQLVCIEPDGCYIGRRADKAGRDEAVRLSGYSPERNGIGAVRRVYVEWELYEWTDRVLSTGDEERIPDRNANFPIVI